MKVFELYFNPKKKQESIFDSFVYEPESLQEKQQGSLCVAGELTRALPQNSGFLGNLASVIKNEFYAKGDLTEAIKSANNFLDKEAKSGNVNWLGNLNFAIINVRDSILNFTKVGNVKILLLRGGEVLDISQNLEFQDQEPYPLKVFSNMASGKLFSQDKVLIVTEDIFLAICQNEELLNQLAQVVKEKELKNVFKANNKEALAEVSGVCLFITLEYASSMTMVFPDIKLIFPPIPKRIILIAILILLLGIAYFLFRDEKKEQFNQTQDKIEEVRAKIMMAENFIIMKKYQEAWDILQPIKTKEASSLQESIREYLK